MRYNQTMKRVNIGDLKAKLSAHLKLVKGGQEVLICERNKPVARIIPYRADDYSEEMQDLIARGIIIPPRKVRAPGFELPLPKGRIIPDEVIAKILDEEREDRF
jgi:prevent-host-death family protein